MDACPLLLWKRNNLPVRLITRWTSGTYDIGSRDTVNQGKVQQKEWPISFAN